MHTLHAVLKTEKIRIQFRLIKGLCRTPIFLISCQIKELIEAVIHAAVLDRQHAFSCLLIPGKNTVTSPVGKCFCHGKSTRGLRIYIKIDHALQYLVKRVPRHPLLRLGFSLQHIELDLKILRILDRGRRQKTAAVFLLTLGKTGHDRLCITDAEVECFSGRILATKICNTHRQRREIMTDTMTCDETVFPSAIGLCVRLYSGSLSKTREHSLGIHRIQKLCIQRHLLRPEKILHLYIFQSKSSHRPHLISSTFFCIIARKTGRPIWDSPPVFRLL